MSSSRLSPASATSTWRRPGASTAQLRARLLLKERELGQVARQAPDWGRNGTGCDAIILSQKRFVKEQAEQSPGDVALGPQQDLPPRAGVRDDVVRVGR